MGKKKISQLPSTSNAADTDLILLEDSAGKNKFISKLNLFANYITKNETTNILQQIYPVGSVYISTANINPSTLFGFGTWQQIKDKFILASGDAYANGTTGGSAEVTLTVDQMPKHYHIGIHWNTPEGKEFTDPGTAQAGYPLMVSSGDIVNKHWVTGYSGGNQSHNNMPPYISVNIWERIS